MSSTTTSPQPEVAELATSPTCGDSFRLSIALLIGLTISQRFIGLARNVIFCGLLEDEELGRWAVASSFLGWAAPFVVLGVPGGFGRLSEHYRQRGHLRQFLGRTSAICLLFTLAAMLVHLAFPAFVARIIFNEPQQISETRLLGVVLASVTLLNFLTEFLTCNPAVGGIAKGHIVRELDALGGLMAEIADRTGIHFRLLNRSRGPAVQSPRCQSDKYKYRKEMRRALESIPGLSLYGAEVIGVTAEEGTVRGIVLADGRFIGAGAVVITAGTFLKGLIHIGHRRHEAGRQGERPSIELARDLRRKGFRIGRLKTGTPPRVERKSIDFSCFEAQPGDLEPTFFSYRTTRLVLPQVYCYQPSSWEGGQRG